MDEVRAEFKEQDQRLDVKIDALIALQRDRLQLERERLEFEREKAGLSRCILFYFNVFTISHIINRLLTPPA